MVHKRRIGCPYQRNQLLPPLNRLKHFLEPDIEFQIGDIREKEVNDAMRKARVPQEVMASHTKYKILQLFVKEAPCPTLTAVA